MTDLVDRNTVDEHENGVDLGSVLRRSLDALALGPTETYQQITVRLHHRGVVLRGLKSGNEIGASRQYRARSGQLILSRIDARNGAIGLVSEDLHGAVVTNDFWLFDIDQDRVVPKYLDYFVGTKRFIDQCKRASEGTTNRVRLQPEQFLALRIPLPTLPEQRRIVARLEEVATLVEQVRKLQQDSLIELRLLEQVMLTAKHAGFPSLVPMRELVALRSPDISVRRDEMYWFAGVYSFGRGVFRGTRKSGFDFAYDRLTRLRTDDFVYPKLMAWEGALGIVPPDCDGLVVSPEFPVFEVDKRRVLPVVLKIHFSNPSIWPALAGTSTGTNVRRRRLHPNEFLKYELPLPSMESQLLLQAIHTKIEDLRALRNQAMIELEKLLPAVLERAFRGSL